jgi:hypothetical protein
MEISWCDRILTNTLSDTTGKWENILSSALEHYPRLIAVVNKSMNELILSRLDLTTSTSQTSAVHSKEFGAGVGG